MFSVENEKLNGQHGTQSNIINWSISPGVSCPGRSTGCAGHDPLTGAIELSPATGRPKQRCYAMKIASYRKNVAKSWAANVNNPPSEIPAGYDTVRIHVSGDFHSDTYIGAWAILAKKYPDITFWAFTRSWRVPTLLPLLERFRVLPNVRLFASTDATIQEATPPGWRVAFMEGDTRFTGYTCPEQTGRKASCADCGYCFKGHKGNVEFLIHGGKRHRAGAYGTGYEAKRAQRKREEPEVA